MIRTISATRAAACERQRGHARAGLTLGAGSGREFASAWPSRRGLAGTAADATRWACARARATRGARPGARARPRGRRSPSASACRLGARRRRRARGAVSERGARPRARLRRARERHDGAFAGGAKPRAWHAGARRGCVALPVSRRFRQAERRALVTERAMLPQPSTATTLDLGRVAREPTAAARCGGRAASPIELEAGTAAARRRRSRSGRARRPAAPFVQRRRARGVGVELQPSRPAARRPEASRRAHGDRGPRDARTRSVVERQLEVAFVEPADVASLYWFAAAACMAVGRDAGRPPRRRHGARGQGARKSEARPARGRAARGLRSRAAVRVTSLCGPPTARAACSCCSRWRPAAAALAAGLARCRARARHSAPTLAWRRGRLRAQPPRAARCGRARAPQRRGVGRVPGSPARGACSGARPIRRGAHARAMHASSSKSSEEVARCRVRLVDWRPNRAPRRPWPTAARVLMDRRCRQAARARRLTPSAKVGRAVAPPAARRPRPRSPQRVRRTRTSPSRGRIAAAAEAAAPPCCPPRFLRAVRGDREKALERWRETEAWRREHPWRAGLA